LLAGLALALAAGSTTLLAFSSHAFAQEACADGGTIIGVGDLVATFPGPNSTNVPIDGFIRLRYRVRAPLRPFVIVQNNTAHSPVSGQVNVVGDEVHWQSDQPLAANAVFRVQVSDVMGGAGENTFSFTTGTARSGDSPPTFMGVQHADTQPAGAADPCGQADAVEVTLSWNRAGAAGWSENDIEYVIYETRGPNIAGPVERARERLSSASGASCPGMYDACRAVRLTPENATAPVCFNIQAVDPYGRQDGNTREVCTDPSRGNFFNGCSVAPRPSRPGLAFPAVVAAFASLVTAVSMLRTRRRRTQR
jgi:hypothetical protein